MAGTGIPRTRLSLAAGLSEMTLRSYDRDGWDPSPDTIRKVEALLQALAEDRSTIREVRFRRKPPVRAAERPPGEAA